MTRSPVRWAPDWAPLTPALHFAAVTADRTGLLVGDRDSPPAITCGSLARPVAASSSRSQRAMWRTTTLTCLAPSVDVLRRPLVPAAVVTQLALDTPWGTSILG
jgi:hypothetical protein